MSKSVNFSEPETLKQAIHQKLVEKCDREALEKERIEAFYRMCPLKTRTIVADIDSNGSTPNIDDLEDDMKKVFVNDVLYHQYPIDSTDKYGRTALFYAFEMDIERLLMKGANPLIKDLDGKMAWEFNNYHCLLYSLRVETRALQDFLEKSGKILTTEELQKFFKGRQQDEKERRDRAMFERRRDQSSILSREDHISMSDLQQFIRYMDRFNKHVK